MEDALPERARSVHTKTLVKYSIGDLTLHIGTQKACVNGVRLTITSKCFLLLHTLAFSVHTSLGNNVLVPREELLTNLYGESEYWPKSNSFDVLLSRLRKALLHAGSSWEIALVYNKGYQMLEKK